MIAASTTSESETVRKFLNNCSSYADHPGSVRMLETHISSIFLTDHFAYKLKKQVKFDFLDFSTPELRRRACLNEVRLNRRLAADVYIDVLPITQDSNGTLNLDGRGQAIDWVVKMRRLPDNKALSVMLREKRLLPQDGESIAALLADFYAKAPPITRKPADYRQAFESHIRANGSVLIDAIPRERTRIRRIQSAQHRYLCLEAQVFEDRVAAGRVVDGHGDLRPEHIYLDGRPVVIDCIEFSDELRAVDIVDDLCFLAMECERLGDGDFGKLIITRCEKVCGSSVPESLFAFYRSYRATVRAKITLLQSQQRSNIGLETNCDDLVRQYLELADRHAMALGPPCVLIIGGLMGTGKSTLAQRLADAFDIEVLSTDHVRRSLKGASNLPAGYGEDNYRPEMRGRAYDALLSQAKNVLGASQSVILDGTFLTGQLRDRVYDLALGHRAVPLYIHCTCPRQISYARIQKRTESGQSESEARVELYDLQARELEPPWADEASMCIDTTQLLSHQFHAVCEKLRMSLFSLGLWDR